MPDPKGKKFTVTSTIPYSDPIALSLFQSGTNAPTVVVNQNDPGVEVFETKRNAAGNYEIDCKNADGSYRNDIFVKGKTEVLWGGLSDAQASARCVILSGSSLQVFTGYDKVNLTNGATYQQGADSQMGDYGLAIKITVYP